MAVTSSNSYGFQGGPTAICHFVVFSPVPVFVISIILGIYHAYRFCIVLPRYSKKVQHISSRTTKSVKRSRVEDADEEAGEERALNTRSRGRSPQRRKLDPVSKRARSLSPSGRRNKSSSTNLTVTIVPMPKKVLGESVGYEDTFACWAPVAAVAAIITMLALSTAVVSSDGYSQTCSQWRRVALRMLSASGDLARVISTRLSCGPIFDFMDYLQPRKVIHYGYTYEFRDLNSRTVREGETTIINTALALKISVSAAWINVVCWVCLIVLNVKMAVERRKAMKSQRKNSGILCGACCRK
ncbi:uncharacterized protein [Hetaerina americana]|uniref:uncharacterized protein n=1 Tax=Hetaerina americana TaxID=62018 RepID=UPI003A7F6179